jgi:hypothetical protein
MGLFSWLSSTGKKSAAAAALQNYYEICQRHGAFSRDPHRFANQIVERACDKLPSLAAGHSKPYLLAAACLTVLLVDEPQHSDEARLYAMGTSAMLQALFSTPGFRPTPSEARIIEAATEVIQQWSNAPSPWLSGMALGLDPESLSPGPITTAHPFGADWNSLTPKGRELAREELVRRMHQSGIKPLT